MVTTGILTLGSRLIGSDEYARRPATATATKIAMTASGLATESRVIASIGSACAQNAPSVAHTFPNTTAPPNHNGPVVLRTRGDYVRGVRRASGTIGSNSSTG